jgi:uncharacterized cupin superfamily protein
MNDSPYLFRAADHPLLDVSVHLKLREAKSGFGVALRYQERSPEPPGQAPEPHWCETGHSIFILSGRMQYRFDNHTVEAGPGDMLHIPAGPAHRHQPQAIGTEPAKYVLTEFD